MNKETLLWATPIGKPDYCEALITNDVTRIPAAKLWAEANGFDRFRISTLDLDVAPDFTKVVNSV